MKSFGELLERSEVFEEDLVSHEECGATGDGIGFEGGQFDAEVFERLGEAAGAEDSADGGDEEVPESGEFSAEDDAGGVEEGDDGGEGGADAFADLGGDDVGELVGGVVLDDVGDVEVVDVHVGADGAAGGLVLSLGDATPADDGLQAAVVSASAGRSAGLDDDVPDFHGDVLVAGEKPAVLDEAAADAGSHPEVEETAVAQGLGALEVLQVGADGAFRPKCGGQVAGALQ